LVLTPESFEALLSWLDPDREIAGQKYVTISAGLVRIFVSKALNDPEYWAAETLDRVGKRVPEIRDDYVGEPVKYIRGVARNIIKEAIRVREIATDSFPDLATEETITTDELDCLIACLDQISADKRDLILDYHLFQGRAKIEHHRKMANQRSLSEGALRTRAHHVRVSLEKCVRQRLSEYRKKQNRLGSHSL
jgi:hypothetical protein